MRPDIYDRAGRCFTKLFNRY